MPVWREIRKLPLAEQEAALRNPEIRRKLVQAAQRGSTRASSAQSARKRAARTTTDLPARPADAAVSLDCRNRGGRQGKDPVDVMIDLALEKNLKQFFMQTLVNENQDHVLEMMKHPRSVVTFSDSGAHVSQIMDSSLQTHVLSHWVREKQALTLEQAIRMLSFVPAYHWGLKGRGLLREGNFADVIVFDPDADQSATAGADL